MRIAINGMGRIGRLLFRRLLHHQQIQIVAVNDIMPIENLAYLLQYDSVYGTYPEKIVIEDNHLHVAGKSIIYLQQPNPSELPWESLQVQTVLECSGMFSTQPLAGQHIQAGAKKVLLSTTGAADIPLLIYGHNHVKDNDKLDIVSPGGCMTNCSTHILYLLQSIGIASAQINVLHSYTTRQELVDTWHKQPRRGRAAAESIIPVEVDLYQSLERLMPGLKDKVATLSIRVPVANGAMADFTVEMQRMVTPEEINNLFKYAAANEYKGVLDYTEEQLVSLDVKGNTHSCLIDGSLTSVAGKQVKIIAWFDNEYGFTSRMIDWLELWSN